MRDLTKCFLEISQATNPNGRRNVKFVLHEIYPDTTHCNGNGITYLEQYTRDNAESVKGMPLCAEFLDNDRDIPYGHGLTGHINNMPVFEDSVQVGSFEDWSIEDIEIDGTKHRCLCATGYINEGRYPKFVKWVEDKVAEGVPVCGSIEFVGTKENDGEIIYDGEWKEKYRVPMVYDYSGYCILSVKPSDSAAVLIELNQFKKNNNMEVTEMNEEMRQAISELKSDVISAIKDAKTVEVNEQVASLESKVSELNQKVEELNGQVEAKDAEIVELNKKCEDAEADVAKKDEELNSKVEELNATIAKQAEELNELKKANKIAELNQALAGYTDEQKDFAKDEIAAFNTDPFSVEINSIVTKIDATAYRKIREGEKALEINSQKVNEFDDIMANVDPIVKDDKTIEDFDVFA